jgi:hypothetical protein
MIFVDCFYYYNLNFDLCFKNVGKSDFVVEESTAAGVVVAVAVVDKLIVAVEFVVVSVEEVVVAAAVADTVGVVVVAVVDTFFDYLKDFAVAVVVGFVVIVDFPIAFIANVQTVVAVAVAIINIYFEILLHSLKRN